MQTVIEDDSAPGLLMEAAELQNATWDNSHEFHLQGKLYDVKQIRFENGKRFYVCLQDELEESIEKRSNDLFNNAPAADQEKAGTNQSKALLSWLQSLYCEPVPAFLFPVQRPDHHKYFERAQPGIKTLAIHFPAQPPEYLDA